MQTGRGDLNIGYRFLMAHLPDLVMPKQSPNHIEKRMGDGGNIFPGLRLRSTAMLSQEIAPVEQMFKVRMNRREGKKLNQKFQ